MFNEENAYPENCDKCRKPKFNAKHPIYCEEKCNIILVSVRCDMRDRGEGCCKLVIDQQLAAK